MLRLLLQMALAASLRCAQPAPPSSRMPCPFEAMHLPLANYLPRNTQTLPPIAQQHATRPLSLL